MFKTLSSEQKIGASEEMQLSRYSSIAGHENLCSVDDLGWSVDYAVGGCVWPLLFPSHLPI